MMTKLWVALFIFLLLSVSSYAKEVHYLVRSPRALLMGDAYTAVANDEYTLFYNPALFGYHSGVSGNILNFDFGVTNVLDKKDLNRFDDFPKDDAAAMADRILDFPIHMHLGVTPSFKMEAFSFSLLANWTSNYILRNRVSPTLDIDFFYDRGFVAGYAYKFGRGGKKTKKGGRTTGLNGSLGVALKHIKREALQGSFPLFGTSILNAIASRDDAGISKIRNELGYGKGDGWGADAGFQLQYAGSFYDIMSGLSVMDIGHTNFKKEYGIRNVPRQEMMVNWGNALQYHFGILNTTFSFDLHPINMPIDFARKVHVGFNADVLGYGVYGGWNGGYLSYGASVNFFIFKLMAGFYGVELGTERREKKGNRILLYLSLLNFSFEP